MAGLLGNPGAGRLGLLGQRPAPGSSDWYQGLLGAHAAPMSEQTYERGAYDAGDEQLLRSQQARGHEGLGGGLLAPVPTPAATFAPAPRRGRVNPLRVASRFILGGEDPFQASDAERARLEAEAQRPQLLARQSRIQSYVDTLPPELQLAFAANPEKLGEAMASRAEGRVLDQGDVYLSGETPGYAAPFEAAPGSSVFDPRHPDAPVATAPQENKVAGGALVDPSGRVLYRGPQVEGVAATADAYVTPEIAQGAGGGAPAIARLARPDAVNLAPGGEVVQLGPDGTVTGRVASTSQRPMSDADQAAVARAENALAQNRVARGRATQFRQQISAGDLNLGPVTNFVGGLRNAAGRSNPNSLNLDALLNWAKEARDSILMANTGVQTDGDAVRALERIISTPNDERVVSAALQRFEESQAATAEVFERDIARRQGGAQSAPAGGQVVTVSTPAQALALQPGTHYRTPDGQEFIR